MRAKNQPKKPFPVGAVTAAVVILAICGVVVWRWSTRVHGQETNLTATATYVGQERCAQCHAEQVAAWKTSHHALAMQVANDSTVLGNFNNAQFSNDGVSSSFFKKDGKFYLRTDGPDGKPQDYDLPYTFGVSPLQQYLVPFPSGRIQKIGRASCRER